MDLLHKVLLSLALGFAFGVATLWGCYFFYLVFPPHTFDPTVFKALSVSSGISNFFLMTLLSNWLLPESGESK